MPTQDRLIASWKKLAKTITQGAMTKTKLQDTSIVAHSMGLGFSLLTFYLHGGVAFQGCVDVLVPLLLLFPQKRGIPRTANRLVGL